MIPKVIHYIWLGKNPMPKIAEKCIESWEKYCPDFEIKKWDETNLDLNKYKFAKDAYDAKKFAFASDVLRTEILYEYGGIYMDIDVELIKPIDDLLEYDSFGGFESSNLLNPGLIWGAEKNNKDLKNILTIYENTIFNVEDCKNITICRFFTDYFVKNGLIANNTTQILENSIFFASDYFSPINVTTNKLKKTKNTYSIHWFNASWYSSKQKFLLKIKKFFNICTFGLFGLCLKKIRGNK